jgi:hypothetical protein
MRVTRRHVILSGFRRLHATRARRLACQKTEAAPQARDRSGFKRKKHGCKGTIGLQSATAVRVRRDASLSAMRFA